MRALREGIAMLNRTNRTLSANLNRLNLGTRSLTASVRAVNVNVAKQNQRVALDGLRFHRGDSMRFGMIDPIVIPIMGQRWSVGVPSSPGGSERSGSERSGFEVVVAELPPVGEEVIRTVPAVGESAGRPRPRSQVRAATARACWRATWAAARTSSASIHPAAARPAAGG